MGEYNLIYEYIDKLLPDDYIKTWGDMNELSENACGIYVRSGASLFNRELDGNVYMDSCNIVINIHSNKSISGVRDGNTYGCKVRSIILKEYNKVYGESDSLWDDSNVWDDGGLWVESESGEVLHIIRIEPIGNLNYLGKNVQGIPVYSLNFNMIYSYKEE